MQSKLKIQTYGIHCWILLPALVSAVLLSSNVLLVSRVYAEEHFSNTAQTVTKLKITDQASVKQLSVDKSTSDTPIEEVKQSTLPEQVFSQSAAESTLKPVTNDPMLSEAEQWQQHVEELIEEIKKGDKSAEDADVLYHELSDALRKNRLELHENLKWARSPSDLVLQKAQQGVAQQADKTNLFESRRELSFIAIDDAHRLVRPKMGGQSELNRLSEFARQVKSDISWIVTMDKPAYQYVQRVRADIAMVEDLIELPTWTQEQIRELIEYRCEQTDVTPDFSQIVIPHQFDETDYETLDERNRSGFYRILWNAAGGNPSVALRLWTDALAVTEDDHIVVRHLPRELTTGQLEAANLPILLLLRVIAQSEMSTINDISESLQLPLVIVSNAIRVALLRGWIEEIDGYYRITWHWFRAINRVLARQNLLTH